jgi:hypothetical protein
MRSNWSVVARRLIGGLLLWIVLACIPTSSGFKNGAGTVPDATALSSRRTVTVRPTEIDDILYNPGMGSPTFTSASGAH